jgi:hypothetical protein
MTWYLRFIGGLAFLGVFFAKSGVQSIAFAALCATALACMTWLRVVGKE